MERVPSSKNPLSHCQTSESKPEPVKKEIELNGPKGLEPTRYGDWEQKGRCTDF
ncbi:MAG: DUF1674 domain-containing protein [Alphaproteobacteria bacterium]|nr:DUF1674 domain-containing protein [Alphaproteobacteria bacterium]